jgi:hypothetical protein
MDQIKVFYDETGHTLTVWFEDPQQEAYADAIDDEMIVMKSESGKILGFEKFNVYYQDPNDVKVRYEHAAM